MSEKRGSQFEGRERRPGDADSARRNGDDPPDGEREDERRARPAATPRLVVIGRHERGPEILTALLVAFVVIAIVKPWPTGGPPSSARTGGAPVGAAPSTATASPSIDPLDEIRRQCEQPLGWRVATVERWGGRQLRTWRSLEPLTHAEGPLDPAIPIMPLGPTIDLVGYCSPWEGAERPPDGALVEAWSVRPPGAITAVADPFALVSAAPRVPSVLGALYRPSAVPAAADPSPSARPSGSTAPSGAAWPAGRYVFRIAASGWERWWAVEVAPRSVPGG